MIRVISILLVLGLAGCAQPGNNTADSAWLINKDKKKKPSACPPMSKEDELSLNLAQDIMAKGRLHSALAHVEKLPDDMPEARLGKARILRLLNRPEAQDLYQSLLTTCLAAQGYHGLAQLAAAQQHNKQALDYLNQAIALAPTNDAMRNDLGVVYLNLNKLDEARFELLTAIEINNNNKQAATSLLAILLYQEQMEQAGKWLSRHRLTTQHYQQALKRAEQLKSKKTIVVMDSTAIMPEYDNEPGFSGAFLNE